MISEYNPSEILGDDPNALRNCVKKYFATGKPKFKLHKKDTVCDITERDIDIISEYLQGGIIQVMERYQKLNQYDYDYIKEVYLELMKSEDSTFESITNYFKTFFDTHFNLDNEIILTPLQMQWKIIMDWTASEELKDVLIKWIDYAEIEENSEKLTSQEKCQLIDIKFIDLDTKPYW